MFIDFCENQPLESLDLPLTADGVDAVNHHVASFTTIITLLLK